MAIKLSDIAAACGVDISTASRALRSDPRVKAETQERVKAKAAELGYRPNLLARSLAAGKTNSVAIVVHGLNPGTDNLLFDAASRYLHEAGYISMVMAHHGNLDQLRRMVEQLGQGLVDAVIVIAGNPDTENEILEPLTQRMPVVGMDRGLTIEKSPCVRSEHDVALAELIKRCRDHGVKKFITGFVEHNTAAWDRLSVANTLLADEEMLSIADLSQKKLATITEPCGILMSTHWHAHRLMQEYAEAFKQMELYIACFDDWMGEAYPARKIFIARQNFDHMAKHAVELCLKGIEDPAAHLESVAVPMINFSEHVSQFV